MWHHKWKKIEFAKTRFLKKNTTSIVGIKNYSGWWICGGRPWTENSLKS